MNIEDITYINYYATCETEGCMNAGIKLEILAPSIDPFVICGPCSQQITKVTVIKAKS